MSAEIIYLHRPTADPETCDHADGIVASLQAGKDEAGEVWLKLHGECEKCGATVKPSWEPDARTIGAILVDASKNCDPGTLLLGERLMEILRGEEDEDNP